MEALRRKLVAVTTSLAVNAIDRLAKKAKLPEFRRDPAFTDVYLRYDALDTLVSLQKDIATTTRDNLRAEFDTEDEVDASLSGDLEMPNIIDTRSEELEQSNRPLVERLEKTHERELDAIESELKRLSAVDWTTGPQAMHPGALIRAFQDALGPLSLDQHGKQLLCELYAQELEPGLTGFYRRLSGQLAGIVAPEPAEAERTSRVQATSVRPGDESEAPVQDARQGKPRPATTIAGSQDWTLPLLETPGVKSERPLTTISDDDVLDTVIQATATGKGSPLSIYQRQQIADALSVIQHQADQPGPDDIKSTISKVLYEGGAFNAGDLIRKEGPVIDFASQIFKEVLTSERIGERLRVMVGRLQIPVIRLAVMNFDVFKDPENPTRQFLSVLLDMAVYASYREEAFTETLEKIVDTLTRRVQTGPQDFQRSLIRLRELETRFDVAQNVIGDPTRQIEGLSLRVEQAQQTVGELLTRDAEQWKTPCRVGEFSTGVWAPYMVRMLAERGEYNADWKEALYVYHQILATSRPGSLERPEEALNQLNALIGPIDLYFEAIAARLEAVTPVAEDWRQQLEWMKRWYKGLHYRLVSATLDIDHVPTREDRAKPSAKPRHLRTTPGTATTSDAAYDSVEQTEPKTRSLPSSVKAGMWFEIYRGPNRGKRRLKLATTRNLENGVRFENRSGHEELSIELDAFIDDLLAGRTQPISDSNVFDQALSHVIANIRTTQEPRT